MSKRAEAWERKRRKTSIIRWGIATAILLGTPNLIMSWAFIEMDVHGSALLEFVQGACLFLGLLFVAGAAFRYALLRIKSAQTCAKTE